jgi:hypothetical protein
MRPTVARLRRFFAVSGPAGLLLVATLMALLAAALVQGCS